MVMVDALVVGGGPVGITTSLLLARRGFSVRVLERSTEIYDLPRAIGMDDEIQRIFQGLGLIDELREITTPIGGAEFVDTDGTRLVGVDLPSDADWPLGHHPTVMYDQPQFEAFLRAHAVAGGVDLRLGVTAGPAHDHGDSVSVPADDGAVHRARWLVAADGASSPIRKQLGIALTDQGYDQDWLVLDVELERPASTLTRYAQQICDPDRPTTYVPGHGNHRRWEFQLQPGEVADEMADTDRVWSLLQPWITRDDARLIRAVVYRFHATVAGHMRSGRVFLAGDAAHQMPPFLGQGLCSGMRDAANLAWKLRLVEDGVAADRLLDSYEAERLPHAADVVAHAVETGRLIDHLSGRAGSEAPLEAGYGGGRPFPRLTAGILVGDHPLVGRQLLQPVVDGRPLDDLLGDGFSIIVDDPPTASTIPDEWSTIGSVVTLPPGTLRVLPLGGAIVVRPDRYVAAVAEGADELAASSAALVDMLH
jgi:3-(3-hydroxy-phenyl)propionate hydroxylase